MDLIAFYDSALGACQERLTAIRRKTNAVSLLRLLLFVLVVLAVRALIRDHQVLWGLSSLGLAGCFVICVNWYFRLKDERMLWEKLVYVNSNEREMLAGKANGFPDSWPGVWPEGYLDDLDIFGPASVFHLLNRTTTLHGAGALAGLLRQSLLSPRAIRDQQEAVKALAGQADLRRLLTARGLLAGNAGDLHSLSSWLQTKPLIYPNKGLRVLVGVLTLANLAALLYFFAGYDYRFLLAGILITRLVVGYFSRAVGAEHRLIGHKQAVFAQYADILSVFSTADDGGSAVLRDLRSQSREAHRAIRQLGRLTSFFDQRYNLLVNLVLNSLAFYDLQCMVALERWKARYKDLFPGWVEAAGRIECLNSLATYAFNNAGYVYPEAVEEGLWAANGDVRAAGMPGVSGKAAAGTPGMSGKAAAGLMIEAERLAHPLIPAKRRVANDFSIGRQEKLILVTGSNMSGKTTFLRTVGVNLLLAQCGAPVCAAAFRWTPMQLLTSLRISDSLQEQTSYFMAELKKLQQIIRQLETGEPALVLIDEILRGTNSEDKTYGSEQFARKLTGYRCLSLFATHDLSLGRLEEELPGVVANYCFESVIEGGDLHFNYRLERGIARNRNASFLMKKMRII